MVAVYATETQRQVVCAEQLAYRKTRAVQLMRKIVSLLTLKPL